MSTLCRAKRGWQKYGGADLPTVLSVVAAAAAKVGTSERPFFCPTHLSAFQKCRINGGRRISDNRKYFGNISDLFFFRRIAPPGLPRRCPEGFGGEGGSGSVKPGQTDAAVRADGQIVCKGFNMNDLRNIQRLGRSNSVKVGQTSSGEGSPTGIRPFFLSASALASADASFALADFEFDSRIINQTPSQSVAVCRSDFENGKIEI